MFDQLKDSAQFRVQMAELGHPVIGPASMSKLTHGEIRIYAEGLKRQNDQQGTGADGETPGTGGASSGPGYDEAAKQRRDEEALATVEQRVADAPDYPEPE